MKNLLKCQEMVTIQQEMYQIFQIITIIINLLTLIYTNTNIPQKVYFIGKLGEDDSVVMFTIA